MEIILFFVGMLALLAVLPMAIGKMIMETVEYKLHKRKSDKLKKKLKLYKNE